MDRKNSNIKTNQKSKISGVKEPLIFSVDKDKDLAEYQTIFDSVPAMVFYKDKNNCFMRTNRFFENVMGMPKEKLEGKSLFDIYPKDQAEAFWKDDLEVINSGEAKRNIIESVNTSNGVKIFRTDKIPYFDKNGQIIGIIAFAVDITEIKKSEETLYENELKYRELANSISDPFTAYDSEMRCIFRNKASEMDTGIVSDKAIGKKFEELHPEMAGSNIHRAYLEALASGKSQTMQTEWMDKKTGEKTYRELNFYPTSKGGFTVISKDITERKMFEKELKQLASFPKLNPNPIIELDLEGNIIYKNPTTANLFPDISEKGLDHPWFSDWKQMIKEIMARNKKTYSREVFVNEKYYHQTMHYLPEYRKIRIYGTNITEQKQKENDLKKLNQTLRLHSEELETITHNLEKVNLAVENASDMIFITDDTGKIIYINRAVKKITGFGQREFIGKKPNFWMDQMPNKFFSQMWQSIHFEKKPFTGELQEKNKYGDIFTAEIRIAPVLDKAGKIISFVGIERDITEIKRIDSAKTEFISLAAHQLRTPITTVSLTAEMLLDGLAQKADAETKEHLNDIMEGIRKMSDMIEMFLNVSRMEMRTFEISPRPLNIVKTIEENIKSVIPQLKNKNIEIRKKISKELSEINWDPKVINIILENLISNSIKYTPENGLINIEAEKYENDIMIKVSDTGCGIPEELHAKIFDKLFRVEREAQKVEGIGLGLYLCKSLIDQTGGKIWVTSELNKGSTFYVSFPLAGMKKSHKRNN